MHTIRAESAPADSMCSRTNCGTWVVLPHPVSPLRDSQQVWPLAHLFGPTLNVSGDGQVGGDVRYTLDLDENLLDWSEFNVDVPAMLNFGSQPCWWEGAKPSGPTPYC